MARAHVVTGVGSTPTDAMADALRRVEVELLANSRLWFYDLTVEQLGDGDFVAIATMYEETTDE